MTQSTGVEVLRAFVALEPELKRRLKHNFIAPLFGEQMQIIIAAFEAVKGLADGTQVIVPMVPTEAMVNDAMRVWVNLYPAFEGEKPEPTVGQLAIAIYRAMLAAPPVGEDVVERVAKAAFDRQEWERHEDRPSHEPETWDDVHETAKEYWREFVKPIIAAIGRT